MPNENRIANLKPFVPNDPRINRAGRPEKKYLTDMLRKEIKGKEEIIIEGFDVVTNYPVKVRVPMPSMRQITQALLRRAKKGDTKAVGIIWDRLEGKVPLPVDGEIMMPVQINFNLQEGNDPIT